VYVYNIMVKNASNSSNSCNICNTIVYAIYIVSLKILSHKSAWTPSSRKSAPRCSMCG